MKLFQIKQVLCEMEEKSLVRGWVPVENGSNQMESNLALSKTTAEQKITEETLSHRLQCFQSSWSLLNTKGKSLLSVHASDSTKFPFMVGLAVTKVRDY